jgi:hypothetical protein
LVVLIITTGCPRLRLIFVVTTTKIRGKVAALIDKGKHLTDEGLAEILLIKDRMNTKRK